MITLNDAKAHLRVTQDLEDGYIQGLINAAQAHVDAYLGAPLIEPTPGPVRAAILLLVADLYEHRTLQTYQPLTENTAYRLLLNPYRSMAVLP